MSRDRNYFRCSHFKDAQFHSHLFFLFFLNGVCLCVFVCVCFWLAGQPAGSCRCKEGFGGLRCDRWETYTHVHTHTYTVWDRDTLWQVSGTFQLLSVPISVWKLAERSFDFYYHTHTHTLGCVPKYRSRWINDTLNTRSLFLLLLFLLSHSHALSFLISNRPEHTK